MNQIYFKLVVGSHLKMGKESQFCFLENETLNPVWRMAWMRRGSVRQALCYALTRIVSFIPYYNLEIGTRLPVLQMRKLRLTKFKQPT